MFLMEIFEIELAETNKWYRVLGQGTTRNLHVREVLTTSL